MDEFDLDSFLNDIGMQPSEDVSSWQTPSGFDFGDISNALQSTDFSGVDMSNLDQILSQAVMDPSMDNIDVGGGWSPAAISSDQDNIDVGGGWNPAQDVLDANAADNIDVGGGWNPATGKGDQITADAAARTGVTSSAYVPYGNTTTPGPTVTPGGTKPPNTVLDKLKSALGGTNAAGQKSGMDPMMLMLLMYLMSQGTKSSGTGSQAVIPKLQANRSQLPYAAPSRPGAGGTTYFNPTTYTPMAAGGMATGGISTLGSYSDGGRLLKGPGDGVSDSIPATIGGTQKAALADGEFVVPARIVSELGNGSTDAGARKLYAMMDRIQKERRKAKNVAADTKADKHLPA